MRAEMSLGLPEPSYIQDWYRQRNGPAFGGDYALTTAHAAKFRQQGAWHVDIAGIQRGDIVFFDWGGRGGHLHHRGQLQRRLRPACALRQLDRRLRTPLVCGWLDGSTRRLRDVPRSVVLRHGAPQPDHLRDARPVNGGGVQRLRDADRQGRLGTGDVRSYAMWQHKCGFSGADADGIPGRTTWDRLRVPRT